MAGFADGTRSSSLAGLSFPNDLYVDDIGNMHILDTSNNRILYWPVNSTMGRMVIGTGYSGSNDNQIGYAASFTGDSEHFSSITIFHSVRVRDFY